MVSIIGFTSVGMAVLVPAVMPSESFGMLLIGWILLNLLVVRVWMKNRMANAGVNVRRGLF